jgi:hypothetical protein
MSHRAARTEIPFEYILKYPLSALSPKRLKRILSAKNKLSSNRSYLLFRRKITSAELQTEYAVVTKMIRFEKYKILF